LKRELEVFMLDFSKVYFETNKAPIFDPIGIYNNYNHSRVHHRPILGLSRPEIGLHIKIKKVNLC